MRAQSFSNWAVPGLLGLAFLAWALSSYPMMRPGFDVWWHLGAIDAPHMLDPTVFPARRVLWHHLWHDVFVWLEVRDPFARALIIHRVQTVVTVTALTLTAYLLLSAMTLGLAVDTGLKWTAALLSGVMWLLMNGTRSVAHDGGVGADVTQSWILWYSVNYQISLPLVLLAIAMLLLTVVAGRTNLERVATLLGTSLAVFLAALIHVAEVAYFLMAGVLVVFLYLRGRRGWLLVLVCVVVCWLTLELTLRQSYALPRLLSVFRDHSFLTGLAAIHQEGVMLRESELTRATTGWHALHTASLLALALGVWILYWRRNRPEAKVVDARAATFVLLTALFPLALMTDMGAGLYAYLTHTYIAWRFSLSSLIFVGVPFLLMVLLTEQMGRLNAQVKQFSLVLAVCAAGFLAVVPHHSPREPSPGQFFWRSLVNSLSPTAMYFGIGDKQRTELKRLSGVLQSRPTSEVICADVFTSYYLFFLERYRQVSMPESLAYLPGYVATPIECSYPQDNPTLRALGLQGIQSLHAP